MSAAPIRDRAMDEAVIVARDRENVVVGNEIIRHRLSSRVIHWCVAATFIVCLFHRPADLDAGVRLDAPVPEGSRSAAGSIPGPASRSRSRPSSCSSRGSPRWSSEPRRKELDRPKLFTYMRYQTDDSDVGKYNGGQKIFFFTSALAALGLLVSGVVLWFPLEVPAPRPRARDPPPRRHFILFAVTIVFHVYLGTAAEPGTFGVDDAGRRHEGLGAAPPSEVVPEIMGLDK